MNLIPRKEVVEEKTNVSRVMNVPGGTSRMTSVVVEAYASIGVKVSRRGGVFLNIAELFKHTFKYSGIYLICLRKAD